MNVPDNPIIGNYRRTGWPDGREPERPHCPVCDERDCGDVFVARIPVAEVVGCTACVVRHDADDISAFRPDKDGVPVCPVCGSRCEDAYLDRAGDVLGCDECVTRTNAWDRTECFGTD